MAGEGTGRPSPLDSISPLTVTNALFETGMSPVTNWRSSNPTWEAAQYAGSPAAGAGAELARLALPIASNVGASLAVAQSAPGVPAQRQQQANRERPEENDFGAVVSALMNNEFSAAESVQKFADVARQRSIELREQASTQLQSDARYIHLQEMAAELELEAATWNLLDYLYGNPDPTFPGGLGGPVAPGCQGVRTYAQQVADLLVQDELLNRVARVVAWLEFLAAEQLDCEEAGWGTGLANRFSKDEGVWRETRTRVAATATARTAGAGAYVSELDPDAATRQGKSIDPDNARDEERLMAYAWRLLRAGKLDAVRQLCADCGQPWRAASLAGGGAQGPVPVGAAAQEQDTQECAADSAADLAVEVDGGCGTQRASWLWSCYQVSEQAAAALRATGRGSGGGLYEAALYGALCGNLDRMLPVCTSWDAACWAYFRCWLGLSAAIQVPADKAIDLVSVDALVSSMGEDGSIVRQALAVVQGDWPIASLRDAIPATFEDIFHNLSGNSAEQVRAGAQQLQRQVQADLILQHLERLLCGRLLPWVSQGTDATNSKGGAAGPPCSPALMRFAAHLGIALQALEVIPAPDDPLAGQYSTMHDAINRLLQAYVIHLMDTQQYDMIPMYCCFLRCGLRRLTYSILLDELTGRGAMQQCRQAHSMAAQWFGFWQGGDLEPLEMAIIAERVAHASRDSTKGGPVFRAQVARWLCFDESTHLAAAQHMALLCREFSLAGLPAAVAGWDLLFSVAPDALQGEVLDMLALGDGEEAQAIKGELSCWLEYFQLQRALAEWSDFYSRLVGDEVEGPSAAEAEDREQMIDSSLPLLDQVLAFISGRALGVLEEGGGAPQVEEGAAVALWVAPMPCASHPSDVQDGLEYNRLSGADAAEFALVLNSAMAAALAAAPDQAAARQLAVEALPGEDEFEGMVQLRLGIGENAGGALPLVVGLVSGMIKGSLGTGQNSLGPLQVVSFDAPLEVHSAVLQQVLYPRMCLQMAAMREGLVRLGAQPGTAADLVGVVAGADGHRQSLASMFSSGELKELLELERLAELHVLERQQQQQNKAGSLGLH